MENISQRIKMLRNSYELTQIAFAKRIGVTNAHISAIEKGKTVPSAALVKLICKEFKVNEKWLLEGIGSIDTYEVEMETETTLEKNSTRLNNIMTRDNTEMRMRFSQIEALFIDIIELQDVKEKEKIQYLDICYKLFYHLSSYLMFKKNHLQQTCLFSYPDDLIENLKKDFKDFDDFFSLLEKDE